MRAAEAAGNTQEMVGDIIRRIAEGSNLVKTTDEKYHDVTMRVEKVTGLVSEISAASREQAQGDGDRQSDPTERNQRRAVRLRIARAERPVRTDAKDR
jgi:hypothetical protein